MTRIIHIGDGKHIEIDEGALHRPPPPDTRKMWQRRGYHFKPTMPKKTYSRTIKGGMGEKSRTIPGFREWLGFRHRQTYGLSPNTGRRLGQQFGVSRKETEELWKQARKQVKKDMDNIKKSGIELDEAGEEALTTTLELMRGPGDPRLKLAAARQVLEWSRSKPATSTNVTVNAAEQWLASLAEENDEADKSTGDA